MDFLVRAILYVAPMYFANSAAMVFGGRTPVDFGARFPDGKPVFGKGKTFKGLVFGIAAGAMVAAILKVLLPEYAVAGFGADYNVLGFLLSAGAVLGDLVGSFIKRRIGIEQGKEAPLLDQLDFVIGAIALGSIVYVPSVALALAVIIATPFIHRISNYIAFKANLKKVPW
ncbi:MAG TPA: CDP-2,3-bis-(O-geranylgeranyl)-sn-glycerol synthase [Candidatus Diapherotrites archaeon]|uniref:CDP-archaeol synthase n=1 Tax=Candidatus Iainarchaeum sp. TaxID=3101447 RepID=A0A7J4J2Q4_9ARCH|nr:CDP-2,3-bis-(O-geranylgeranyl)-sn-glycerol synthase [Candidatus Diapherotrites archaeon]